LQTGFIFLLCLLHLPSISRAWLVPVDTLLSLIFFAFSIAFVVLLSATTKPPLHGMLMPSAVLDSVHGDGGFFGVSKQMAGGRIGGGFAEGLSCTPLGHDLVPYWPPLHTFCIHLRCACLASVGICKQATWLALFLQLLKQNARVCQRVHMVVSLSLALSVRHIPANCVHNLPSFSLKSTHCCLFSTTLLVDFLLLFSFSSSCFLFFDFIHNPAPPFSLHSSSNDDFTALKDAGRITLN
jgi:hypothetical protein